MEHIDFFKKKKALHQEMLNAITELLETYADGVVELNDDDCHYDDAFVIRAFDGYDSTEEVKLTKVKLDGRFVKYQCHSWDEDWCDLERDALFCSIDSLYDALYQRLVKD